MIPNTNTTRAAAQAAIGFNTNPPPIWTSSPPLWQTAWRKWKMVYGRLAGRPDRLRRGYQCQGFRECDGWHPGEIQAGGVAFQRRTAGMGRGLCNVGTPFFLIEEWFITIILS